MFIRYLDYLSPRITFYYRGFLSHSSIFSGIISIIAITFILILAVYYSLDLFQRKSPNTFFFKSFIEDAGTYEVNSSSLFHFINVVQKTRLGEEIKEKFDFSRFSIIGVQNYVDGYLNKLNQTGLKRIEHWLYGYCDKNINIEGLDDLVTYDFFNKSACIKYYFNRDTGDYYEVGDPNFKWPKLAYGSFKDNNEIYGLYIQKCKDNIVDKTLGEGSSCENIGSYFKEATRVLHLYFINNYINVLDYKNPNNKFFYRIENPFQEEQYSTNDININPTLVRSHDGFVLDNIRDDISYMFDRNDVYIKNNEGQDIFLGYCFFLKNIMEYYERTYKRIQDIISSIGGINTFVNIVAFYLNYLYNNYIILSDTEQLLYSSIHLEKDIHKKKSIQYRNLKHIKDIDDKNKNSIKKSSERKSNRKNSKNKDDSPRFNKAENTMMKSNNNFITNIEENKENTDLNNENNNKKDKKITNRKEKENLKDFTFWNYISFAITFRKKNRFFIIYENFRIKIMSEEHLIRNHLNIFNLLKIMDKKRHIRRNSYHLKELIKAL